MICLQIVISPIGWPCLLVIPGKLLTVYQVNCWCYTPTTLLNSNASQEVWMSLIVGKLLNFYPSCWICYGGTVLQLKYHSTVTGVVRIGCYRVYANIIVTCSWEAGRVILLIVYSCWLGLHLSGGALGRIEALRFWWGSPLAGKSVLHLPGGINLALPLHLWEKGYKNVKIPKPCLYKCVILLNVCIFCLYFDRLLKRPSNMKTWILDVQPLIWNQRRKQMYIGKEKQGTVWISLFSVLVKVDLMHEHESAWRMYGRGQGHLSPLEGFLANQTHSLQHHNCPL